MNGLALRSPLRSASLCSGGGGLDLGLRDACGVEPVVYVERDAYAAACLVARMEEASVAPAPIWDDLATFDGHPWRGVVDLVAGGTPCQDLSVAGKRAGLDGERSGLFWEFCRIVREAQPAWLFWENVGGAVGTLPRVLEEFAGCGYVGAWAVVRASDVGAPHGRARVFVLGYSPSAGLEGPAGGRVQPLVAPAGRGAMADANRVRQLQPQGGEHLQRGRASHGGATMAHANGLGREGERIRERGRDMAPRAQDSRPTEWPPARDAADGWARVLAVRPDLAPALPGVRGVAHGLAGRMGSPLRADQLRLLGNGVVPAQAAHAFRGLYPVVCRQVVEAPLPSGRT